MPVRKARRPWPGRSPRTTFSGGEQLAYDLQQHGRATVVGERTRGGAHPRRGFRVTAHLEATIPVARAVHPVSGTNWEGTGITPDVEVAADRAYDAAYRLALTQVLALGDEGMRRSTMDEAGRALATLDEAGRALAARDGG